MAVERRRAVSPIIATVILIAITIVLGAALWAFAASFMRASSSIAVAEIQGASITTEGSGGVLTLSIYNPGTVAVVGANLTYFGGALGRPIPLNFTVQPGGSAGVMLTPAQLPALREAVAGRSYLLGITVRFANNGTEVLTATTVAGG